MSLGDGMQSAHQSASPLGQTADCALRHRATWIALNSETSRSAGLSMQGLQKVAAL